VDKGGNNVDGDAKIAARQPLHALSDVNGTLPAAQKRMTGAARDDAKVRKGVRWTSTKAAPNRPPPTT
jgi:hypothetical protein